MSESQDARASDGIPSLVEHWRNVRVPLQGQSLTPQTGKLHLKGIEAELTASGHTLPLIPHDELVMQTAVLGFADPSEQLLLVHSIAIPWIEILKELERDPLFLQKIDPRKLEELVADAYRQEGYKDVILTPYSNDKGRDVIVSATLPGIGTIKIVDQVKRYAAHRRVTANDVRALFGVVSLDQSVSKGIVTTTSDFAPGIQTEFATVMPNRLELRNGLALKQWLDELYSRGKA
jgi:restriction system protein